MNFKPDPEGGTRVHIFIRFTIGGKVKAYVTKMMAIFYAQILSRIITYIDGGSKN